MRVIFLLLTSLLFFACSLDGNSTSGSAFLDFSDDDLEGMVRVSASNANSLLGTNDTNANVEERPRMRVKIDYSFSMGKHEVTCGEFNSLMKSQGLTLSCENKKMPATDLTYYDAVLYANEKSKKAHMDTVYTYTSKQVDGNGHCTFLEGFNFHADVDAYRLPTEAEWVLVAGRDWNPQNSWNAENSQYKLHEVCTKNDDSSSFCDLAGNAMEWVNDWLGFFRDTTIYNYAGSPDGGNLGKRIVKGGSYRHMPSAMNLYSRTDVYTVTSSTRAEYVGFRLAYGSIPDAVWMGYNGLVNSKRVISLVNQRTLKSILGSYKIILAFRNNLNSALDYLNYSSGTIYTAEIADGVDVYHPEISPNGRYVAYSTGLEGVSGSSAIYVRMLSLSENYLNKLDVKNAAIPRWRVLPNGDTVIVYVTDAGNNKDETSFKKASTWQVTFMKGRFGKPQKIMDGAYHDGISVDNRLAVSGARLLRAKIADSNSTVKNANDTLLYNGEQACNVSLAQDGSKKMLFLDFGGKTGRKFVGESYGVHERLLVMDSTGKLIQSVKSPDGYSFDHSEWVHGRSDLAVVSLADANGMHKKIALVNLTDSSIVDLVEGDDLWQPSLWVPETFDRSKIEVDEDSAGVYMHEGDNLEGIYMRYNMELLWRYRDTASVVVLGSSRPLLSISPKFFGKKYFTINLAQTPNSIYMSRDYLDNYIFPHVKNLKYIILSLDIDLWYKDKDENFFESEYKQYAGYVYDKNHDYWKDGYPQGLMECTANYLSVEGEAYYLDERGLYTGSKCKAWGDVKIELDSMFFDEHPEALENSMNVLKDILQKAEDREIFVVGVIFPQNPKYKETGAFGRYGMRRSLAKEVIAELKDMQKTYPHFRVFDQNKMGDHDYADEKAGDTDHLCIKGASQISTRLYEFIKTLR